MKLQCPCGAKYAFDLTPEMLQNPVKFVCPACGLDSSEFVNQLVRQEFGNQAPPPSAPEPPPPAAAPRLKISHAEPPAAAPAEPAVLTSSKFCPKHRQERATEKCVVCGRLICPRCMEQFGYFCSPLCKNKADLQGLVAPVYAGQKFEVERRFWRKTGLLFGALAALVLLFFGGWTWYAWFGSVPHNYFSLRFEDNDRAYAGASQLVGKDQVIFLHGGTLARYDLKTKKPVWSLELITKEEIAAGVKAANDMFAKMSESGGYFRRPGADDVERGVKIGLQEALQLHVSGENIWVGKGNKLTHYDWANGKVVREVALPELGGALVEKDGELLMLGEQSVTHISLASGESRVEEFRQPGATTVAAAGAGAPTTGGLLAKDGNPLDPNKVAAQAQNLKLPARIALPALIASAQHEQQLEAAMRDDDPKRPRAARNAVPPPTEYFDLVPGAEGFVQFSKKLIEQKIISHTAMKAPPKTSSLNGDLNVTKTAEVANELLNEMQRNNGGDTVEEDVSRYQVTVHLPDSPAPDWTAEVTGPPQLFVLKTVNVVTAGKTVIVLDKSNQKLWQAALTYPVSGGGRGIFSRAESQFGAGPCVERGDVLYVFDEAVLSAFELSSGNARWRVPSVGVVGLFFDDAGFVYVNTTSGNPDDIKYSRQIDITKHRDDILMKLDSKTGKTLWSIKPGGFISYLSGKFIYTVQSYDPNPTDEDGSDMTAALQKPPYLRIARVDPKNGRILWEHFQDRCPVDVRFDHNTIELVFKREVQVLKYLTF